MPIISFDFFWITLAPTWYGLMYALWFLIGYSIIKWKKTFSNTELDSLFLSIFVAVILWGRLWYVLLYNASYFLAHPIEIFQTWNGGMSFHGATLAVICSVILWSLKYKKSLFSVWDAIATVVPIGIWLGRIGNYINGELYGFAGYTGPFAIIHDGIRYFPTPLLEACFEWIILFIFVNVIARKYAPRNGYASATFLIWYGVIRFLVEFFRIPDAQIWYLFSTWWLTLGQLLSIPLIIFGIIIILSLQKQDKFHELK